jgi:hypothetical protein
VTRMIRNSIEQQRQRNDYNRRASPTDHSDEIATLWSSLREDWLSPEGRANTAARIAYLESLA